MSQKTIQLVWPVSTFERRICAFFRNQFNVLDTKYKNYSICAMLVAIIVYYIWYIDI